MEAKFTTLFNCSGRHHPENSENERFLERFEKKELEGSMKSFALLDPLSGVTKFEDGVFGVSYSFMFLTLKNTLEDEIYPMFKDNNHQI